MSAELGPLYHWSPRDRLNSIKRNGLLPGKPSIAALEAIERLDEGDDLTAALAEWRASWVCLATTPVRAWNYSHGAWRTKGTFDLWSVTLVDSDEVVINPMWGSTIIEVRVHNRIPKSRLVFVGERTVR